MAKNQNQSLSGAELFAEKYFTLNDEKKYKLEFTNRSLIHLEMLYEEDMDKIFSIYQGNMSASSVAIGTWACLISHNEEFRGLGDTPKEVINKMIDYMPDDEIMALKFIILECFGAYWNKQAKSKQIPDKYKELFEQYQQEEAKKK